MFLQVQADSAQASSEPTLVNPPDKPVTVDEADQY